MSLISGLIEDGFSYLPRLICYDTLHHGASRKLHYKFICYWKWKVILELLQIAFISSAICMLSEEHPHPSYHWSHFKNPCGVFVTIQLSILFNMECSDS
jgi:hypothetical protein